MIQIKVVKGVYKITSIIARLYNHEGNILSEQALTLPSGKNAFSFKFTDNFPDYAGFIITTGEPSENEYTIKAQEFIN